MNGYVHDTLTRQWAEQVGFSVDDAHTIGLADINVDRRYSGHLWRNKRYHFGLLGAGLWARRWFAQSVETGDLELLGQALHCRQDAVSHGIVGHVWHYPGIDLWNRRSERMRRKLERVSKDMLRSYLDRAV